MSTFNSPTDIEAGTLARSSSINNLDAAIAAAFALLPTEDNLTRGTINYAVDTGTANTYLVDLPHAPSDYVDGLLVCFRPINTNTGASTINVNSLGVKSIKRAGDLGVSVGDISAGMPIMIRYSTIGSCFYFINSVARSSSVSGNEADILVNAANIAQNIADIASNLALVVANNKEEEFRNFLPIL